MRIEIEKLLFVFCIAVTIPIGATDSRNSGDSSTTSSGTKTDDVDSPEAIQRDIRPRKIEPGWQPSNETVDLGNVYLDHEQIARSGPQNLPMISESLPSFRHTFAPRTRQYKYRYRNPPTPAPLPNLSFDAGDFSMGKRSTDGILKLSNGLSARPIARAGMYVHLANNRVSSRRFHKLPDGAAVFKKKDGNGWVYASNAENGSVGSNWDDGGVGVLDFNAKGEVIGYYMVARNTRRNCGGGKTPWNSWVTCEESSRGQVIQTDPFGKKSQATTAMGSLGYYESFAYDDSTNRPTFYVTRDKEDGVITRFVPDNKAMECYRQRNDYDRWCTLDSGSIDYLYLQSGQRITWTKNYDKARRNADRLYPASEGIDIYRGQMYFTSKKEKRLVIVNLRRRTYSISSTKSGAFSNQPDQIKRVLGDGRSQLLFFCEDGGRDPGLHGRNASGHFFTILHCDKDRIDGNEETTGIGMSPDGLHMYISVQQLGIIYDITRDDKRPFSAAMLDIKYHAQ